MQVSAHDEKTIAEIEATWTELRTSIERATALLEQADAFILKHQAEVAAATSPTPSALIDPVPRAPR